LVAELVSSIRWEVLSSKTVSSYKLRIVLSSPSAKIPLVEIYQLHLLIDLSLTESKIASFTNSLASSVSNNLVFFRTSLKYIKRYQIFVLFFQRYRLSNFTQSIKLNEKLSVCSNFFSYISLSNLLQASSKFYLYVFLPFCRYYNFPWGFWISFIDKYINNF